MWKPPNLHELIVGMSGMGKSISASEDIVAAGNGMSCCIICEDPHPNSLSATVFELLVAHGHEHRILYDQLYRLDHFLGYDFLTPSKNPDPLKRDAENDLRIRNFVDILLRRRGTSSIASSPLTEEWVMKPCQLFVNQDPPKNERILHELLEPRSFVLRACIDNCTKQDVAAQFKPLYDGKLPSSHYLPAYRLISGVTKSPAFAVRCGATFDFEEFLSQKGVLLIEGGSYGVLSHDALRIILGAISNKVIEYVRNRAVPYPVVKHYLDEANNISLISEHETRALAELRKNNYGLSIMVQTLDFPTSAITQSVLNNTGLHRWFACSSAQLAQQAAADLGDPELKDATRSLQVGQCYEKIPGHYRLVNIKRSLDPWTFPGLLQAKAEESLKRIHQRPEYQSRSTVNVTKSLNSGSKFIPAPSTTLQTSSPIDRLHTEGSPDSENETSSDSSEA